MKLLVLGGTRFLGRHLVDAALRAAIEVTIFTRGRQPVPWGNRGDARSSATAIRASRPGSRRSSTARGTRSSTAPATCRASSKPARGCSQRACAVRVRVVDVRLREDRSAAAWTRRTPVARLADPATEQVMEHYGALKAACETVVEPAFGTRATQRAPGSHRRPARRHRSLRLLGRAIRPSALLGARAASAVVPAPRERAVQFVDARDLAAWMLDLAARGRRRHVQRCSSGAALDDGRSRRCARRRVACAARARVDRRRQRWSRTA